MKYKSLKKLDDDQFRRLTGVKRKTFEKMVQDLKKADTIKKSKGGRKNALIIPDQLLMMLEYSREYRTYFHISQSYGVSESTAFKTIKWVEDTLIKVSDFALPGKKSLLQIENLEDYIALIDATESPIERPKKTKEVLFRQEEKAYFKNSGCC